MADDIAYLGVDVDTTSARTGKKDLDSFADEAERTGRRTKDAMAKTGQAMKGTSRSINAVARASATGSYQTRVFLLQLSQVAQQGQTTGDYLQALSIQAADIGLAFGSIGIIAGVAAGALLPMAANLVTNSVNADKASSALEKFSEKADEARKLAELAAKSIPDLTDEFGDFAQQVRTASDLAAQANIQLAFEQYRIAIRDINDFTEEIINQEHAVNSLGESYSRAIEQQRQGFATSSQLMTAQEIYEAEIDRLMAMTDSLGLTLTQVRMLDEALAQLQEVDSMKGLAQAAADSVTLFERLFGEAEKLPPEVRDAVLVLEELLAVAASTTTELGRSADEAGRLGTNLGTAIGLSETFNARSVKSGVASGAIPPQALGDLPMTETEKVRLERAQEAIRLQRQLAAANSVKASSSRSAAKAAEEETEAYKRAVAVLRELARSSVTFEQVQAELIAMFEAGTISADEYRAALEKIAEQMSDGAPKDGLESQIDSISSSLAELPFQANNIRQSLADIWRGIAADILAAHIRQTLLTVLGNIGGGGGGIFGSVIRAASMAWPGGGAGVPIMHGGGIAGETIGLPTVSARSFLTGEGLSNDAVPALLQQGETVLPKGYQVSGGDVNITIMTQDVNSFNQSRSQVATDLARAVQAGRRG
jgi:tetratricopeptide (TPR) repeat protein